MAEADSGTRGTRGKVDRVIQEYDLDGVGDTLVQYWTREEDRYSLRDLADYFNRTVLRAAVAAAGMDVLDGEIANIYRLLTDDEVTAGQRIRVRRRLERAGVDVDRLRADFVSRQAIHTYLTKVRDAERETGGDPDPVATEVQTIRRLRNRTRTVATSKLERLHEQGHVDLPEFRVLVDVQVLCERCGSQLTPDDLPQEGGCGCAASE